MTNSGAAASRPVTGGRLADVGLIRPLENRKFAGVCAGLGRVTGTDALLWRVVLATLMVLYGSGLALYLIGWLVMPSEGDSASALGALFSKRRSSVPRATTALLLLAAMVLFVLSLGGTSGRPFLVFGLLLIATVLLSRQRAASPPPRPPAAAPPEPPPAQPATVSVPAQHETVPAAPAVALPQEPQPEPSSVDSTSRPKSVLGLVIGSLTVIGVSIAAMTRLQGAPIRMDVVFALGLLTCGLGLLVASWWGRARGLILLGLAMLVGMAATPAVHALHDSDQAFTDQQYRVNKVDQIPQHLKVSFGRARVDLSAVDFQGESAPLEAAVTSGTMQIEVPNDVDVVVDMNVHNGTVEVEGDQVATGRQTFNGEDGSDGELSLTGNVKAATVEVNR